MLVSVGKNGMQRRLDVRGHFQHAAHMLRGRRGNRFAWVIWHELEPPRHIPVKRRGKLLRL